jgi:hypothetical protein
MVAQNRVSFNRRVEEHCPFTRVDRTHLIPKVLANVAEAGVS